MQQEFSFSVTIKPESTASDLSPLIRKWNSEIKVQLVKVSNLNLGPISIYYFDSESITPFSTPISNP